MTEEEFKLELTNLHQKYADELTDVDDGQEMWVTMQYERAFGLMNGAWNPAVAGDYLVNLQGRLE